MPNAIAIDNYRAIHNTVNRFFDIVIHLKWPWPNYLAALTHPVTWFWLNRLDANLRLAHFILIWFTCLFLIRCLFVFFCLRFRFVFLFPLVEWLIRKRNWLLDCRYYARVRWYKFYLFFFYRLIIWHHVCAPLCPSWKIISLKFIWCSVLPHFVCVLKIGSVRTKTMLKIKTKGWWLNVLFCWSHQDFQYKKVWNIN